MIRAFVNILFTLQKIPQNKQVQSQDTVFYIKIIQITMTHQAPETPTKQENYVPKMKPGDVEIPNRVFVKGFPREATADDLFTFFEEYGQVLECRIVADRNGYSKGK